MCQPRLCRVALHSDRHSRSFSVVCLREICSANLYVGSSCMQSYCEEVVQSLMDFENMLDSFILLCVGVRDYFFWISFRSFHTLLPHLNATLLVHGRSLS